MVIPIWLALIAGIIIVFIIWKLIKFAFWVLVIIVLIALALMGLDYLFNLFPQIL